MYPMCCLVIPVDCHNDSLSGVLICPSADTEYGFGALSASSLNIRAQDLALEPSKVVWKLGTNRFECLWGEMGLITKGKMQCRQGVVA